jgi:VWFA-related protein
MQRRPRTSKGLCTIAVIGATALLTAQNQPVVKSSTELVRISVLARDHNGKPVTGLEAGDFSITDDTKPQDIVFFDASGAASPTAPSPAAGGLTSPDGYSTAFSNLVAADRVRNVTVILLDRLNTVWSDQAQARDGIRKFLSKIRPDDRVALYALDGTALHVLHDFTSDTASLLRALSGAARTTTPQADAQTYTPDTVLGPDLRTGFDSSEYQMQFVGVAAYTTITALQTIGQHLSSVPGRKSLVWISSAFPIGGPNSPLANRAGTTDTVQIQRATHALNTAGISVYPIDARGLTGAFSDPGTATRPPTFAGLDTVRANTEVMHSMADDTGGRVFINTNDIGGAIRSAIDDADAYYVIGYYPPAGPNDGRYRQIGVNTRTSGIDLRYRHGYFSTAADAVSGDRKTTLERAIRDVLNATGIPVTVNVAPGQTQDVELSIAADGRAIALKHDTGAWTGSIDLAIAQVQTDGALHLDTDTTIALKLTDEQHAAILESGLTLTRHITVAPNTARVAVVIRDIGTGALGSVFLPAAKLRGAR